MPLRLAGAVAVGSLALPPVPTRAQKKPPTGEASRGLELAEFRGEHPHSCMIMRKSESIGRVKPRTGILNPVKGRRSRYTSRRPKVCLGGLQTSLWDTRHSLNANAKGHFRAYAQRHADTQP